MKTGYEIRCDGTVPNVYINGKKLRVVSLVYKYHTKTAKVSDAANICIVEGYFEDEPYLERFVFDSLDVEKRR